MSKTLPIEGVKLSLHQVALDFKLDGALLETWLSNCATSQGYKLVNYEIVICTDSYLLDLNQRYLRHDELTDIVTFDYSEEEGVVKGEAYISLDRVQENATLYGANAQQELLRVVVHGLLHLCGHGDKSPSDKKAMRSLEAASLKLAPNGITSPL